MRNQKSSAYVEFLLLVLAALAIIASNSLIDGTVKHHNELALSGALAWLASTAFKNRPK